MAKDPGFIFYPGDYLRDTQTLSEKAQVAYDRIMCEHMRNICITQKQLNFFTKRLSDDEKSELMFVLTKIPGGYQIEWVALSINKRRAYSDSRRKNREGKSKKDMNNISKTYDNHMENENENENINDIVFEYNDLKNELKNSSKMIELLIKNEKLNHEYILDKIEYFINDLEAKGENKSFSEVRKHFINWIKKEKSSAKKETPQFQIPKNSKTPKLNFD